MKRITKTDVLMLAVAVILMLGACSASFSKSYTFNVETGDTIKMKLDTSNGLSSSQEDGRFTVKKDEENVLQGMFTHETGYNSYLVVRGQQGVHVPEDTEKDGNTYYMYEIEGESGTEENFVVWIRGSKAGMLIASSAEQKEAKEAFESLTITKEWFSFMFISCCCALIFIVAGLPYEEDGLCQQRGMYAYKEMLYDNKPPHRLLAMGMYPMFLYHSGGIEYDLFAATSYGHVYLYNDICVYPYDLCYLMGKNVQNPGERVKGNGQKGA